MEIQVSGTYHDISSFVSGVASLPRIVTLHDLTIASASAKGNNRIEQGRGKLSMTVQARTYRYGTEADRESTKNSKKKRRRK